MLLLVDITNARRIQQLGEFADSKGMASDPRNYLFESYVKILEHYKSRSLCLRM